MTDSWGSGKKRKRKTALRKLAALGSAAARAVRKKHDGNDMDVDADPGDESSDKENDIEQEIRKEKARGDHFKEERDRYAKKAKYWEEQAVKAREEVGGLKEFAVAVDELLTETRMDLMEQKKELEELEAKNTGLKEDKTYLQQKIHALNAKIKRIPGRLATVVKRASNLWSKKEEGSRTYQLKEKGVITDEARNVLNDLVALDDVPEKKVVRVFKRIASSLGVNVEGNVTRRSVSRIVKEGGNASKIHIIDSLKDAEGVTLSGDGTTHKNETYETKFTTINTEHDRLQFFLGIKTAVNHTSETQRDGWIELIEEMYHLAFESGLVDKHDARTFWNLVTGFHSDHAEDQKKLFRLLQEWKMQCDRELRGERLERQMSGLEHASFILRCGQAAVERAGGPSGWDALSLDERSRRIEEARRDFIREIGQGEYDKLSAEEKAEADFFLWAGCCMHKEMNAFKGGCAALEEFYDHHPEVPRPKKMYNRDNAAAVDLAPDTAASKRAEDRTKGGAIKVVSLAGAIFRHKDRKRGQQDTLRFFFDHEIGFVICFPDTSNTRFQSHAEACAVLITYLELFIKFLGYVKENKASRSLNHMEQNVWDGLHCNATRHEICVITLYWLAVSVPYMREIRGPFRSQDNVLLLGDLHRRVIAFIDTLIAEPERLIGENASYQKGTFDGKSWERPEAFYAVQRYAPDLPHLKELLVAFLKGAKETWIRFSSEYAADGAIAKATAAQIDRAWMESTNDLSEGSFATFRQSSKRNPTMSVTKFNARQMYKFNGTSDYLRSLGKPMRKFLRKITRRQDESGANRRAKMDLALHKQHVAEEKVAKTAEAAEKRQAKLDAIDRVVPIISMYELEASCAIPPRNPGYMSAHEVEMQISWHGRHGPQEVKDLVPKGSPSTWGTRLVKIAHLRAILEKHIALGLSGDSLQPGFGAEEEETSDIEVTIDDLEEFYDSEDDYYT